MNCTSLYKYEYNNICYKLCPNGTHNTSDNYCIEDNENNNNINNKLSFIYTKEYEEYFNNNCILKDKDCMIFFLENEIINNTSNLLSIIENEKKDIIIKEDDIIFEITSPINQKNNEYNNISNIIIGECENDLRNYYNISSNITLIILKIDIYEKGLLIPIIEYEIYNSKTKERLNLNVCKNNKINIYIPVSSIDEKNLFKYNSSDEYYNDICYSYSKNNIDIILKDRRNEFINNYMSLCETNCEYLEYNIKTKKSLCKCNIKKKFSISGIISYKDKLLVNFIDIKNSININLIKCYGKVFNKKGLLKNLGNYFLSIIILSIVILFILFKFKGYNILKDKIKEIKDRNPPKKGEKYIIMNSNDKINYQSDIRLDKVFNNYI